MTPPRRAVLIPRAAALLATTALIAPAAADPRKVLVLQSEGRADPAARARIDAAILRLAIAAELDASPSDVTFSDAATAVGCKPDAPSCKDEVLGMLGVDEILTTTVVTKLTGTEIFVRRVGKTGAARDAAIVVATGASLDKLDGLAPVFDDAVLPPAAAPGEPITVAPPSELAEPVPSVVETAPLADDPNASRRRLEIIGMAGGAGSLVVGLVLWSAANGLEGDIEDAPTRTRRDLLELKDLESRADRNAMIGNVLVLGGLALGAVSTYFYIRDRRSQPVASAQLTPIALSSGAGVALTIGALPGALP